MKKLKQESIQIDQSAKLENSFLLLPLWPVMRVEWRWWLSGAIAVFFLASVLMSGWPDGLIPNIKFPFIYSSDGLSHSWMVQRILEGWINDNPRSGYPFGSSFLDYPNVDVGNFLVLKLIGFFAKTYAAVLNLYFLFGFSVVFISSYVVLRSIYLDKAFSISAAIVFAFLPFHFMRLEHLFYTWYFVVPIFIYIGLIISLGGECKNTKSNNYIWFFCPLLGLVVISSFGVYYALFGVIVLGVSGFVGGVKKEKLKPLFFSFMAVSTVALIVFLNTAPSIWNNKINGSNAEVAVRSPASAEIYGLKLIQLFLPHKDHRNKSMAEFTADYEKSRPLVNENNTSSLGILGSIGFVILAGTMLYVSVGKSLYGLASVISIMAIMVAVLFLFGTIGGLGAIFSTFISASIRGWNRISVFIAFGSLVALFVGIQIIVYKLFRLDLAKRIVVFLAILFAVIGVYDQTAAACVSCNKKIKAEYDSDKIFIDKIEKLLPAESAVYQMPYMPFPEVPPLHQLQAYDLTVGFLHSQSLRWNYAGMKGRTGDLFYRSLALEPIEKQVEVVRKLGFAGIYIDRRGYQDGAVELIKNLTLLLKKSPTVYRADEKIVFFDLQLDQSINWTGFSPIEIMKQVGYFADKLGSRYAANISDGIDFNRIGWPDFVSDAIGFSGYESSGRWTDANIAPTAKIIFDKPLPNKFTLIANAQVFDAGIDKNIQIIIGDNKYKILMPAGILEMRILVDLNNQKINEIEFMPPQPKSPAELGLGTDQRKLGIRFINLKIIE